jgi:hypothetical protein
MFVPFFAPDEPDDNTVSAGFLMGNYRDARTQRGGDIANNWITNDKSSSSNWATRQAEPSKYASGNKNNVISDAKDGTDYGPNAGCGLTSLLRLTNVRTAAGAKTVTDKLGRHGRQRQHQRRHGSDVGLAHHHAQRAVRRRPGLQHAQGLEDHRAADRRRQHQRREHNPNNAIYTGYGYIGQGRLKNASNQSLDANSTATTRRDAIDSRQTKICANADKAAGVVYSIGVGVSAHSKTILQQCATKPDMYYDVTTPGS